MDGCRCGGDQGAQGGTGGGADIILCLNGAPAVLADFIDAIETGRGSGVEGGQVLASQRLIDETLARAS